MLHTNSFKKVNLWPRGVDLSQFSPSKRSQTLRAEWGVGRAPTVVQTHSGMEPLILGKKRLSRINEEIGTHYQGRKASLPLTPPESPDVGPEEKLVEGIDEVLSLSPVNTALDQAFKGDFRLDEDVSDQSLPERIVLLFVGRM